MRSSGKDQCKGKVIIVKINGEQTFVFKYDYDHIPNLMDCCYYWASDKDIPLPWEAASYVARTALREQRESGAYSSERPD